jgi:Flp pilus assembly protein TadG
LGILKRLRRDATANMMAIGAASIIPLIGVIGGGVDASRMYLAQSRLQQSCDSATLAARKKLAGSVIEDGVIPADIESQADNFFNANFPTGQYGTTDVEYDLTAAGETQMDGAASAKVPATLMRVFGYEDIDIAVTCSADLNLPNIDVVLVLDNSGSMRNSRMPVSKQRFFRSMTK